MIQDDSSGSNIFLLFKSLCDQFYPRRPMLRTTFNMLQPRSKPEKETYEKHPKTSSDVKRCQVMSSDVKCQSGNSSKAAATPKHQGRQRYPV